MNMIRVEHITDAIWPPLETAECQPVFLLHKVTLSVNVSRWQWKHLLLAIMRNSRANGRWGATK